MLSYHNDENLKKLIVCEMRKHKEQDQLVKDTYCREECGKFKGCAVGCAIDSINIALGKRYRNSDHKVFEEELGIPEWLAHIQDLLFERLPIGDNSQFAVDFLESIPVGVNLESVKWKFCAFLMRENIERVLSFSDMSCAKREKSLSAIRAVLALHEKAIEIGDFYYNSDECAAARSAAWSAAEPLARSAAWSASESVARSAAESAAWSAESASDTEVAYKRYSVELIRLLKEAK